MIRQNLKIFFLFVLIVILLLLFKNGRIFDIGFVFRYWFAPSLAVNSLFEPASDLTEEYKELLVENSALRYLEEENAELRALLNFQNTEKNQLVLANVINRDPLNRNILIIDAGSRDGLLEGQAAVVNDGIIIGKIIDLGYDFAKIRLLTDSFSQLPVKIGNHRVSGLLSGSLGLGMELSYIPQDQEVKIGDLVFSAGLDSGVSSGLIAGRIEEISFSPEEVFKSASVSPIINYDTVSILAIVTSL
ncbi:MAG: rod shape-determining protein MreC [Patescibacteria group bacterium]|nr:rod shape-determining protein MreC [Patescibacteria group bacterium]